MEDDVIGDIRILNGEARHIWRNLSISLGSRLGCQAKYDDGNEDLGYLNVN